MAKTKEQKGAIVAKLEDAFRHPTVFVGFTQVNVADETQMRRGLREAGVSYLVAKKTLIARALKSAGHEAPELQGEIAVAYGGGDDATAAARLVHEWGKKLTDKLSILGGIFEGSLVDAAYMQEIATIPPLPTLRAMFAQVINSPRQRFAVVLSKVAETRSA